MYQQELTDQFEDSMMRTNRVVESIKTATLETNSSVYIKINNKTL
jgi:hypothetical protein